MTSPYAKGRSEVPRPAPRSSRRGCCRRRRRCASAPRRRQGRRLRSAGGQGSGVRPPLAKLPRTAGRLSGARVALAVHPLTRPPGTAACPRGLQGEGHQTMGRSQDGKGTLWPDLKGAPLLASICLSASAAKQALRTSGMRQSPAHPFSRPPHPGVARGEHQTPGSPPAI